MKFCFNCGASLQEDSRFCPACGTPLRSDTPPVQPAAQSTAQPTAQPTAPPSATPKGARPSWLFFLSGIAIAAVVAVVLFFSGVFQTETVPDTVEGPGYDSPEEAAIAYAEFWRDGNFEGMLSTFAIESYVEHYDAAAYCDATRVLQPHDLPLYATLSSDKMTRTGTIEYRRGEIAKRILYHFSCNFLLTDAEFDDLRNGSVLQLQLSEEERARIIRKFSKSMSQPLDFSDMEIGKTMSGDTFLSSLGYDEEAINRYLDGSDRVVQSYYDAEALQDVCLSLTIDDVDYVLFLRSARYNGKWFNISLGNYLSSFLAIDAISYGLVPTEEVADRF